MKLMFNRQLNRAFDYNMVIFAYHEVAHNRLFTAPENIALENEYANLTLMLQKMAKKKTTYKTRLQLQKDYANEVKPTAFINTLNKARK